MTTGDQGAQVAGRRSQAAGFTKRKHVLTFGMLLPVTSVRFMMVTDSLHCIATYHVLRFEENS